MRLGTSLGNVCRQRLGAAMRPLGFGEAEGTLMPRGLANGCGIVLPLEGCWAGVERSL